MKKKNIICTIIGNRPQFIKWGPLVTHLRATFREVVIHTGQHYDDNMSGIFFKEMELPEPDHNLRIGSGSHAKQTGEIMIKLEPILKQLKPVCVIIFGDTNSTLAGALTAAKLGIPIAHIEAGLRLNDITIPEEINRVCADHLSSFNFCPHPIALKNLRNEGKANTAYVVGDVMYDAYLHFLPIALELKTQFLSHLGFESGSFFYMSMHRPSNVDNPKRLRQILEAISKSKIAVLFVVHPRTLKVIADHHLDRFLKKTKIRAISAIGYLESLFCLSNCKKVITDSGGMQKEAYFAGKPCIVLSNDSPWRELVELGNTYLTYLDPDKIVYGLNEFQPIVKKINIYGKGYSAIKIVNILNKALR